MIDANAIAKILAKTGDDLCGECNLWKEVQHLLALLKFRLNHAYIHFGFTGTGYTVKQCYIFIHKGFLRNIVNS